MWYRIAKNLIRDASRVLKTPEKTWHMTGQDYQHPIIDTDPNSPMNQIGFGADLFGAGHYTSTNPFVLESYKNSLRDSGGKATARESRLPRGTRILNMDAVPVDEAKELLLFLCKKQGRDWISPKQYAGMESVSLKQILDDAWVEEDKANHLLKEFGYDAIEYRPFTNSGSDGVPEKYLNKKNILILNDAIINNPREFTRSRLRQDTGPMAPKNTTNDLYMRGTEKGSLPISMIPPTTLNDPTRGPQMRQMVLDKFKNGDVDFKELPAWAKADHDILRHALDYSYISASDIPYEVGQDEEFMHALYEDGLVPFWALPESLRKRPDMGNEQEQYGTDTANDPFAWADLTSEFAS